MKRKNIILSIIFLIGFGVSFAQNDLTLYQLKGVPQTNLSNPSFIPEASIHFGVPFASSIYAGFGNSGAKYNEIFTSRTDDSVQFNPTNFLNEIKDKNNINFKIHQQWLNYGMMWKGWYFNFSVADVEDFNLHYSNDLISLGLTGNGSSIGQTINLSPLNLKHIHYREYALGAAYQLDDAWTFGAKVKLLFGRSAVKTSAFDARLSTAENTYYLNANYDVLLNTSLPDGMRYDSITFNEGDYMFGGKNFGLALDLGASYVLDDKFSFSASVLDIGYIKFKENIINYQSKQKDFSFQGLDLTDFIGMSDSAIDNRIEHITDSLTDKFKLNENGDEFTTMLTAKFYLGGNYKLSNHQDISVLFRGEIFNNTLRPSFTAAYKHRFNEYITAIGSYTAINRNIGNIGLGAMVDYKFAQFYIVTDNIFGVFMPDATKYGTIHLGFNIFLDKGTNRSMINL